MAVTTPVRPRKVRIGDLLVQHQVISEEQLNAALAEQKKSGRKLGRVLIESGIVGEEPLLNFLARQLGISYIDLRRYDLKPEIVQLIPEVQARRFRAVVLAAESDGGVLVGMSDPTDLIAYDELSRLLRKPLRLAIVREADLLKAIDLSYRRTQEIKGIARELEQELSAQDIDLAQLAAAEASDAPVVRLLQSVFEDAVQVNASDIHIEPDETQLRIRFRLDGVLRVQATAERRIGPALVSRLKLMAGLDISEKRLPQDGRFQVRVREASIDVRLSTLPTQYGESAVMRLLNPMTGLIDLERIGMPPETLARFRSMIHSPHGMVLVTGPTGSGKTTTLYAALRSINKPSQKIITAEDPIEYRLPGINQVQVNARINLSFARVLRSVLRQDPDIILVGEMRDNETVEIGLRAALTGHLVLSTLHTNDAVSTASRLFDMSAPGYLLAASLRGIVAQRLVRRICEACAEPHAPEPGRRALVERELGAGVALNFRRGRGCNYCNHSGYQGRTGVYELLEIDESLVKALHRNDPLGFAEAAHQQPGFKTLRRGVMELAARGGTTLDQVLRATYDAVD